MRVTTGFKYNLPFESWVQQIITQGGQQTAVWTKVKDEKGLLVQAGGGINLVTAEPLPLNSQVRNLKDAAGKEIFVVDGETYPMYVISSDPQFDPFIRIIGWKHMLRRELPRDYMETISSIVGNI